MFFFRRPGFSGSADRRAAAAHGGRRSRREETALSGAQPSSRVPLQAEAQDLGELSGEESRGADVYERLPHGKCTTRGSFKPCVCYSTAVLFRTNRWHKGNHVSKSFSVSKLNTFQEPQSFHTFTTWDLASSLRFVWVTKNIWKCQQQFLFDQHFNESLCLYTLGGWLICSRLCVCVCVRMRCLCYETKWLIWSSCCWPIRTVLSPPYRRRLPTWVSHTMRKRILKNVCI